MAIFKGAGVAIVTPMKANLEVNYEKLKEMIEFQINNGTDAIIICGTTGESSTLTHEEHLECIKFTVECVNKRVPVIAGTGSNCTNTAIYLSQECTLSEVLAVTCAPEVHCAVEAHCFLHTMKPWSHKKYFAVALCPDLRQAYRQEPPCLEHLLLPTA